MAGAAFNVASSSRNRTHPNVERRRDKRQCRGRNGYCRNCTGRDHAEATSSLGDIEATAPEIGAAMATVLRLGGFVETPARGDAGLGKCKRARSVQRVRPH